MRYRARLPAAAVAALAAVSLAAGCSSAPSYPHSWCSPLIAQFHARETRAAYVAALLALDVPGVPLGSLVRDETAYAADEEAVNGEGAVDPAALGAARADLGKVGADLRQLNVECGQPADAYESDTA